MALVSVSYVRAQETEDNWLISLHFSPLKIEPKFYDFSLHLWLLSSHEGKVTTLGSGETPMGRRKHHETDNTRRSVDIGLLDYDGYC